VECVERVVCCVRGLSERRVSSGVSGLSRRSVLSVLSERAEWAESEM
jgi:hypothetical protein